MREFAWIAWQKWDWIPAVMRTICIDCVSCLGTGRQNEDEEQVATDWENASLNFVYSPSPSCLTIPLSASRYGANAETMLLITKCAVLLVFSINVKITPLSPIAQYLSSQWLKKDKLSVAAGFQALKANPVWLCKSPERKSLLWTFQSTCKVHSHRTQAKKAQPKFMTFFQRAFKERFRVNMPDVI